MSSSDRETGRTIAVQVHLPPLGESKAYSEPQLRREARLAGGVCQCGCDAAAGGGSGHGNPPPETAEAR